MENIIIMKTKRRDATKKEAKTVTTGSDSENDELENNG